jgi:hypothetical protein
VARNLARVRGWRLRAIATNVSWRWQGTAPREQGAARQGLLEYLLQHHRRSVQSQPGDELQHPRRRHERLGRLAEQLQAGSAARSLAEYLELAEEKRISEQIQLQMWQDVPYIPLGHWIRSTAHRRDLVDLPWSFPAFYGVRRA